MATVKRNTSSATTISNSLLFLFIFFFIFVFPAIPFSIQSYFLSSSSSSQKFINRGSSISSSSTVSNSSSSSSNSFWLSPSGLFAFGFYPLNSCDHQEGFIIGIWLVKSSRRILVWSINRDELPYSTFTNATSLLLKRNGKFVIQTSTSDRGEMMIIKETPLFFNISSRVSYGLLRDNGNLVFYDWNSNIIWESFNYPTDTILPGQTLNPGQSLVNIDNNNRLTMMEDGNLVLLKDKRHEGNIVPYEYVVDWESHTKKKTSPIELRLNSTGHLYLADRNSYIMKRLDNDTNNDTKQQNDEGMIAAAAGAVLYRATLDSDGVFRLYKEIISSSLWGCRQCECEKTENSTIILWGTNGSSSTTESDIDSYVIIYAVVIFLCYILM